MIEIDILEQIKNQGYVDYPSLMRKYNLKQRQIESRRDKLKHYELIKSEPNNCRRVSWLTNKGYEALENGRIEF